MLESSVDLNGSVEKDEKSMLSGSEQSSFNNENLKHKQMIN